MKIRGHELTAFGVYAGIGSPLVGAARSGFRVTGNVENRPYYYITDDDGQNTFSRNFGIDMVRTIDEVDLSTIPRPTVVAGHPKCGSYSNLVNLSGQDRQDLKKQKSDALVDTLRIVRLLKPLFFFMDNLPKFLLANPIEQFVDALPNYDIDVAWVCNAGYGNCQWNRNRLFIIASRKELHYKFVPNELPDRRTLADVIGDLSGTDQPWDENNHVTHTLNGSCKGGYRLLHDGPMTWREARLYFRNKTDNKPMHYYQKDTGEVKHHFGYMKCQWHKGCRTLTGITPKIHPVTNLPLSPRERARVLGFPDDFIFCGLKFEPDGTWRHHNNISVMRQTGNCIPIEFPAFLCRQFKQALMRPNTYPLRYSGQTTIKENPIIEETKEKLKILQSRRQ